MEGGAGTFNLVTSTGWLPPGALGPFGLGFPQDTRKGMPFNTKPTLSTFSAASSADVRVTKFTKAQFDFCTMITDLISPNA
jgi:hypothetical protein